MNPGIFSDKSIYNLFKHNVCTFSVSKKELVSSPRVILLINYVGWRQWAQANWYAV